MKDKFSYIKGFSISFNIDENEIKLKLGSINGLEELYLNENLVSKNRTYSKNSEHIFSIDNIDYKIQIDCSNLSKGPWYCSLYKESEIIEKKQISFIKEKKVFKDYIKDIAIFIVTVCILLFMGISFDLPNYYISIPTFFVVFILLYPKIFIEIEDIDKEKLNDIK